MPQPCIDSWINVWISYWCVGNQYTVGCIANHEPHLLAYALIAHLSWRWTFYLGIIINSLALLLVTVCYWPPDFVGLHPEGKSRFEQFKELDFVGLLLFGGGLMSFFLGISFGGNPYSWQSATVLAPTIIGGKAWLKLLTLRSRSNPPI